MFALAGQPEGQTIAHATLGSQVVETHVPGLVVDDLLGDRVEDIELKRGTAQLWFGSDFVQVRWFTGSQEPCDSFTVTVAGGTEDGNRHAAVDLADRLLLPHEIGVDEPPITDGVLTSLEGAWQLERSTGDLGTIDGHDLQFTFSDGTATWTDGCNTFEGVYRPMDDTRVHLGEVLGTKRACPLNPTTHDIQQVMGPTGYTLSVVARFIRSKTVFLP